MITQKPVALMEYLIKTYTNEGEPDVWKAIRDMEQDTIESLVY